MAGQAIYKRCKYAFLTTFSATYPDQTPGSRSPKNAAQALLAQFSHGRGMLTTPFKWNSPKNPFSRLSDHSLK
jgi:hypothetical protein